MFPTLQLILRPGIIDLGWGHPSAALLPVTALREAAHTALGVNGTDALSYGADQGAGPLLTWLHERVMRVEGRPLEPTEIALTGGASDALDQICTLWTQPGDTVLVEAPTYHLALRILHDHDLRVVPIPTDAAGLQIDALTEIVATLRRAGQPPRFLYTIPTFHNPTGRSLSPERRVMLGAFAADEQLLLVEDDVYRELSYDGPAPASLWSCAPPGTVIRLGSFAKSLAPGLRLGWITGSAEHISRIVGSGRRDSGGGVNHFAAMIVGAFCNTGAFEPHIARLQAAYRQRRDTMFTALATYLPPGCAWTHTAGGYFVWLQLPHELNAGALRPVAEAAGVSFVPGSAFFANGGGAHCLRLAFSLYAPDELEDGVRRLGQAISQYIATADRPVP